MHIKLDVRLGWRRMLLVAAIAAAVATPVAFAVTRSDVFSDVPSTAADHDAINRVYHAGIMKECASSPSLQFCPNNTTLRRGIAKQYDYALGLSGTPGSYDPTFRSVKLKNGGAAPPLTVDSSQKVANLNADKLDGKDSTAFLTSAATGQPFSVAAQASSAVDTTTNCASLTTLPAGDLIIESIDVHAFATMETYLRVRAGATYTYIPLVLSPLPSSSDAAGHLTTALVIKDGNPGTAGTPYRDATYPVAMCLRDSATSISYNSLWTLSGRVLS